MLFITAPLFSQERSQGLVTLEPFWRQALGGAVISLPSVQVQSAVVALDGGNIRAYSTAGTPLWNYSARGRISPYVTRSREGTSYFSRTNGTLIAINRSGRELWRRDIENPLCAMVIPGWDGRLFVPTDKKIFCFTASGNLLWTRTLETSFSIAPKLDRGGGIIFALENNEVYRVDPFGNAHVWMLSNTPAVLLSIRTDDENSRSAQQRIVTLYADGTLEILGSAEDWFIAAQSDVHSSLLPRLPSSPVAAAGRGNNVAALLGDGRVALVSLEERRILWEGDSHIRELSRTGIRPEVEAEVLYDDRGIFILSRNGASGFSDEGRRLWYTFLVNAAAIPAFGSDGVLYSGGRDWILYAYRIEEQELPVRGDLYGPMPEGAYRTGTPQPSNMPVIPLFENEKGAKLAQIQAAINAGRVGANEPEWTVFLMSMSAGQEQIQYRISALRMLGQIGSWETVPWLLDIFRRENEPMVRAAAASAIGAIGVDPDGIAMRTFHFSVIPSGGIRNEQVLVAIASAAGSLSRFSGPPLSETGVRILNLLSDGSQPPVVRNQAQRELSTLR